MNGEFQKIRSNRSVGARAENKSLRITRTRSASPCRATFSNVFSMAASLMSRAVTREQPLAAMTDITPVPQPTSRNFPPSG